MKLQCVDLPSLPFFILYIGILLLRDIALLLNASLCIDFGDRLLSVGISPPRDSEASPTTGEWPPGWCPRSDRGITAHLEWYTPGTRQWRVLNAFPLSVLM
ncbi:hypothetical protein Tcan_03726 [Toxocara canis]|uniref:Uncharacterized protein n=1 Tax=Toxocara canis TaxID=6265 RepID=A0A0B2V5T5_TOXCA|nr:hypothetical protein Tcan_03726 [Toxocara canis]